MIDNTIAFCLTNLANLATRDRFLFEQILCIYTSCTIHPINKVFKKYISSKAKNKLETLKKYLRKYLSVGISCPDIGDDFKLSLGKIQTEINQLVFIGKKAQRSRRSDLLIQEKICMDNMKLPGTDQKYMFCRFPGDSVHVKI